MVNTALLRSAITKKGTNVTVVAAQMGVDKATLYRRMADSGTFTIGEVEKLTSILYFFYERSRINATAR